MCWSCRALPVRCVLSQFCSQPIPGEGVARLFLLRPVLTLAACACDHPHVQLSSVSLCTHPSTEAVAKLDVLLKLATTLNTQSPNTAPAVWNCSIHIPEGRRAVYNKGCLLGKNSQSKKKTTTEGRRLDFHTSLRSNYFKHQTISPCLFGSVTWTICESC